MKHSPDWSSLPPEVLVSVFEQLPVKDLGRAAKVCRAWNRATHFPQLWQQFEFVLSNASK
jgi:F-box and leucine-rich repeat protein 14